MNEAVVELEKIAGRFETCVKMSRDDRTKLHDRIGTSIEREVRRQVASKIDDSHGKVQSWQVAWKSYGYAAVRPRKSTRTEAKNSNNSPGAITNYLEHGTKSGIEPKEFYHMSRGPAWQIAEQEAQSFKEELAARLRGEN